jgi:VWFA-related protein
MRQRGTRTKVAVVVSLLSLAAGTVQDAEKHVFVTALDRDGTPIVGMRVEHFAVSESGRERKVIGVEPLRTPMHAAVLVDTSVAGGTPDETFRSAVIGFIERLAVSNYVAVYSFGDRAVRVADFTQDAAALRGATMAALGWSHDRSLLIDAIDLALRDFEKAEPPRPVMIAITSESPEASGKTAGSVIKRLISHSVAFHAVSLASATGSGQAQGVTANIPEKSQRLGGLIAAGEGDRERNQMLQQGTSVTGGGRQRVTSILAIGSALARTANELANGYKVTFARPGSARMEDLQVGVLLDGVTLRATAAPFGTR